jgi:hypothetical protein
LSQGTAILAGSLIIPSYSFYNICRSLLLSYSWRLGPEADPSTMWISVLREGRMEGKLVFPQGSIQVPYVFSSSKVVVKDWDMNFHYGTHK